MRTFILGFAVVAALTSASAAEYAPLDCSKANAPSLFAICANYSLGQAEARMATLYGVAASLVAMGQRGDLIDTQRRLSHSVKCEFGLAGTVRDSTSTREHNSRVPQACAPSPSPLKPPRLAAWKFFANPVPAVRRTAVGIASHSLAAATSSGVGAFSAECSQVVST